MNSLTTLLLAGAAFAGMFFIGLYIWPNWQELGFGEEPFDLCKVRPNHADCINLTRIQEEQAAAARNNTINNNNNNTNRLLQQKKQLRQRQ